VPDIVYGDQFNQSGDFAIGKIVYQGSAVPPPPHRTVLLLMSNPADTPQLGLHKEHRAICEAVARAKHRDRIDIRTGMAPRPTDLYRLLSDHEPAVVHYAGHSGIDGIALLDEHDQATPVDPVALEGLFAAVGQEIRCVVLNACLTHHQAAAISAHVPCVVGMSRSVLDSVAIEFAAGFHGALADGRPVASAFEAGRNRLALQGMDARDPVLIDPYRRAGHIFLTR
jgi:hypothetical protein